MEPLISILVPVYNVEPYFSRCVDSIMSQTYKNLEIILVDDGSTDESGMLCDQYAAVDSRVKLIHQENAGVGIARNIALSAASGEYFMFVDPDDYISMNAVQVLYERIVRDESEIAAGKYVAIYSNGTRNDMSCKWMKDGIISGEEVLSRMGEQDKLAIALWAKLYKREVFDGIACPSMTYGEDLWIFPALMEKCNKISLVDQEIYYYFQRESSIIHTYNEKATCDRLHATLFVTKYLWERSYLLGAYKWFGYAIEIAWPIQDREKGSELFIKYFTKLERRKLMDDRDVVSRIKYISLYSELLYRILQKAKKIKRFVKQGVN